MLFAGKKIAPLIIIFLIASIPAWAGANEQRLIIDATGRRVNVPVKVERVLCSGPGCLRLLTYLQAQDRIVGVDDMEKRHGRFDARPYALANPQFKDLPLFGEFRGRDNPELILSLEPEPQVIFKTFSSMGHDPQELQDKTGIPVVVLNYGDLGAYRNDLFQALTIMGDVLGISGRAGLVQDFFTSKIAELEQRAARANALKKKSVYIGGVAKKGPHGFQSTEPGYPPFVFVNAYNVASAGRKSLKELAHANVAKEKIVDWNPEILFLDLSTLELGDKAGGLYELSHDPAYKTLTALNQEKLYGLLPYNWYSKNFGSILANAFFIGKVIYPEQFSDIDPDKQADLIYSFLVGKPVFSQMNAFFANKAFKAIKAY